MGHRGAPAIAIAGRRHVKASSSTDTPALRLRKCVFTCTFARAGRHRHRRRAARSGQARRRVECAPAQALFTIVRLDPGKAAKVSFPPCGSRSGGARGGQVRRNRSQRRCLHSRVGRKSACVSNRVTAALPRWQGVTTHLCCVAVCEIRPIGPRLRPWQEFFPAPCLRCMKAGGQGVPATLCRSIKRTFHGRLGTGRTTRVPRDQVRAWRIFGHPGASRGAFVESLPDRIRHGADRRTRDPRTRCGSPARAPATHGRSARRGARGNGKPVRPDFRFRLRGDPGRRGRDDPAHDHRSHPEARIPPRRPLARRAVGRAPRRHQWHRHRGGRARFGDGASRRTLHGLQRDAVVFRRADHRCARRRARRARRLVGQLQRYAPDPAPHDGPGLDVGESDLALSLPARISARLHPAIPQPSGIRRPACTRR